MLALAGCSQHHPVDGEPRDGSGEREDRAAAPDLDVVGVGADDEQPLQRLGAAGEPEGPHQPSTGMEAPPGTDTRQGALPDSCSASRRCRSLIVSIGPKKPS